MMSGDMQRKARWVEGAMAPIDQVIDAQVRSLMDLPNDVTPGARDVAQLTAWRTAQVCAVPEMVEALGRLKKLKDWKGGFLIADKINFDWKTAPFVRYASFEDFYEKELADTYGDLKGLVEIAEGLARRRFPPAETPDKVRENRERYRSRKAQQCGEEEPAAPQQEHGSRAARLDREGGRKRLTM